MLRIVRPTECLGRCGGPRLDKSRLDPPYESVPQTPLPDPGCAPGAKKRAGVDSNCDPKAPKKGRQRSVRASAFRRRRWCFLSTIPCGTWWELKSTTLPTSFISLRTEDQVLFIPL